jgi:hypothetical protein
MNFVESNKKFIQNNPLNEKEGRSFSFSKSENPTYSLFELFSVLWTKLQVKDFIRAPYSG